MGINMNRIHILGNNGDRTLCGLQLFTKDGRQKRALDGEAMAQYLDRVTCGKCKDKWMSTHTKNKNKTLQ